MRKAQVRPVDLTSVARSRGYRGEAPVKVHQGRVVSHKGMPWERFIRKVRLGRL